MYALCLYVCLFVCTAVGMYSCRCILFIYLYIYIYIYYYKYIYLYLIRWIYLYYIYIYIILIIILIVLLYIYIYIYSYLESTIPKFIERTATTRFLSKVTKLVVTTFGPDLVSFLREQIRRCVCVPVCGGGGG